AARLAMTRHMPSARPCLSRSARADAPGRAYVWASVHGEALAHLALREWADVPQITGPLLRAEWGWKGSPRATASGVWGRSRAAVAKRARFASEPAGAEWGWKGSPRATASGVWGRSRAAVAQRASSASEPAGAEGGGKGSRRATASGDWGRSPQTEKRRRRPELQRGRT